MRALFSSSIQSRPGVGGTFLRRSRLDGSSSWPVRARIEFGNDRNPALRLWTALRECADLSCRFSTTVGFLVAKGPLVPARVFRPDEAAVLAMRSAGWGGVVVAPHLGRRTLHVSAADGESFLRVTPGAALLRARWAACLRLAEALPAATGPEWIDVFNPTATAFSSEAEALPRFFRNLFNVDLGFVVTMNTRGLRVRYPLRAAHIACDGGRLLAADARSETVLQLELVAIIRVRRDADDSLVLLDANGREAIILRMLSDDPGACAKTWAAVARNYFSRR